MSKEEVEAAFRAALKRNAKAKEVAAHGKEIKAAGAVYCDCPACAAVEKILAKKDEMLA